MSYEHRKALRPRAFSGQAAAPVEVGGRCGGELRCVETVQKCVKTTLRKQRVDILGIFSLHQPTHTRTRSHTPSSFPSYSAKHEIKEKRADDIYCTAHDDDEINSTNSV